MIFKFYVNDFESKRTFLLSNYFKNIFNEINTDKIIGEDIFGNILVEIDSTVKIIDHEDLNVSETYLNQEDLIATISAEGFSWIDCYSNIDILIIEKLEKELKRDEVLHWVQPLFLGGKTDLENIIKLDRLKHWEGHLSLIKQLRETVNGSNIIIK